MSPAKTAAQRKATERAKKAAAGLTEVRGIYAPPAKHAAIKAAAQVVRGVKPLAWTDARKHDHACHYDHCIAETPFGRFLLTWKGWKDYPAYTADETPWNEWAGTWGALDEAKQACEAEFARRLTLCLAA